MCSECGVECVFMLVVVGCKRGVVWFFFNVF